MRPRLPAICLVLGALAACGKGNDTLNNQNSVMNTKPMGYVAGLVTNAATDMPLAGANVQLMGGGLSNQATTDDKGSFQFGPIAAGAMFALRISAPGMTDATIAGLQIGDAAGNFPTDNGALYVGPIGLIPTTGKFSVEVVAETGAPVPKAMVTFETVVRYLAEGVAKGSVAASSTTDMDGLATVTGLPDLRALPPHLADAASLVISVAPVGLDNNGKGDLRGTTVTISGAEVRSEANIPVIVLPYGSMAPLSIVASNIERLAMPMSTTPSVLDLSDPIRVVFSEPIDRASVSIDLRDETGTMMLSAPFVTGTLGNVLFIMPTGGLMAGMKYNLALRAGVPSGARPSSISAAAPFFAKVDATMPASIGGRFHDVNGDGQWGNDGDQIEITASIPIGRPGQGTPFVAELWLALDLDNNRIIGDSQGELPGTGQPYPPPLLINGVELPSQNGAPPSGFSRYFTPLGINLGLNVRGPGQGPVSFELRIDPANNGGLFVTDAAGRMVTARTSGAFPLQ